VVQAAEDRFGVHGIRLFASIAGSGLLLVTMCSRRIGNTWPKGHMRASGVVVTDPRTQDGTQMRLGERNQPIQTLATDGSDESLANGVRLRASRWGFQNADTEPCYRCIKVLGEYAVAIMK